MVAIGDSKTYGNQCSPGTVGGYRPYLDANLDALGTFDAVFMGAIATPGIAAAGVASIIQAFVDGFNEAEKIPESVLINIGTNDAATVSTVPGQTTWKNNMGFILDTLHTKWATSNVYLMRVYYPGQETSINLIDDTLIPAVLATRSAWAFVGPDERTFLPGNLCDPVHPNATGDALTADEWQTVIGY